MQAKGNSWYKLESLTYSNDLDGDFLCASDETCRTSLHMHTRMCMCTSRCKAVIAKLVTADTGPELKGLGHHFYKASHSIFA